MFTRVTETQEMSNETSKTVGETPEKSAEIQPIVGRFDHRLDPKRRFTIPSDWFERMGRPAQVYVMPSLSREKCLDVFTPAEFDKRLAAFRSAALSDAVKAKFVSRIGELVSCCSLDVQNRIRVKDSNLDYVGIHGDVVLIGAGYHFEVWSLANRPKTDGQEADLLASLVSEAQSFGF